MIYWGVFAFVLLVLFTFFYKCCCEPHPPLWERGHEEMVATL